MTIIYRDPGPWGAGLGTDLDAFQVDSNFFDLDQRILNITQNPPSAVSIQSISVDGDQMLITLTNSVVLGPFTLPTFGWNFRGAWQPDTVYAVNDVITANGNTYIVTFAHTSDPTFDAGATDGAGHNFYTLLLSNPSNALPIGGATGQALAKASGANYDVSWQTQTLAGLNDASISSPSVNDILVFTGSHWVNSQESSFLTLNTLADVQLPDSFNEGMVLEWNGTDWVPTDPTTITLSPNQIRNATATNLSGTGAVVLDPTLGDVFKVTPSGDITFTASSAPIGAHIVLEITTSSGPHDLTFGSGFGATGDIICPTTPVVTTISFIGDGSNLVEVSRSLLARKGLVLGNSSGTQFVDPLLNDVVTVTPTGNLTFNSTSAPVGKRVSFVFITSGTTPYTISFSTNFAANGVLSTGSITAQVFTAEFIGDGNKMNEVSRTAYFAATNYGNTNGTKSIDPSQFETVTIQPNGNVTFNATNAPIGKRLVFFITSFGSVSVDVTFSTNFNSKGPVPTGPTAGLLFIVEFVGDGTTMNEVSRNAPIELSAFGTTNGTLSVDPGVAETFTITPNGAVTFNATLAPVGKRIAFIVITSGTSSYNVTFSTNFISTGVLATGAVSNKRFVLDFIGDGVNFVEMSRTTAM
jgi:hypothetical protein